MLDGQYFLQFYIFCFRLFYFEQTLALSQSTIFHNLYKLIRSESKTPVEHKAKGINDYLMQQWRGNGENEC